MNRRMIIAIFLAVFFIACEKSEVVSDGGKKQELEGDWQTSTLGLTTTFVFRNDGTFLLIAPDKWSKGEWSVNNNKLILREGKETVSLEIMHLDDSLLVLKGVDKEGKENVNAWTRIK